MPVVLFAGVVGARNFTMECRKGRRKGLLSGLVFAWLLTSGCTVAARNIGECSWYLRFQRAPIPNRRPVHRMLPPGSVLVPIKPLLREERRPREYLRAVFSPKRLKNCHATE